jgi:uncharacterized protein YcbK (DUF882 family)
MGGLSVHFSRSEFTCSCGCGYDTVDALLLEALEAIRGHFGVPVTITSAARCFNHNRDVGGARNSQHKKGRAADIQVKGISPQEVSDYAVSLGFSVGNYLTFTHIDSRSGPVAFWEG